MTDGLRSPPSGELTFANTFPGVDGERKRGRGDVPDVCSLCNILNYIRLLANKLLLPMLTHVLPGVRLLQKIIIVIFLYLGDTFFHHSPQTSIISIAFVYTTEEYGTQ